MRKLDCDALDVARTMTVCVNVRYRRWPRFAVGAWLMRIGARIAGCRVEIRSGDDGDGP
jgi:hypothetical protein